MPLLLGGPPLRRAYPLTMVLAEKLVTAVQRGAANTRWSDFVDVAALSRRHAIEGAELRGALERVARHRLVDLVSLVGRVTGLAASAQPKWAAWRRKHRLPGVTPEFLADLLREVAAFGDPPLTEPGFRLSWAPAARGWE